MRLITRDDTSLAVALIVGTLILFQRPLQFIFDVAEQVERQYHLDLIQALVVLCVVFMFHEYRKRQEARAEARAAASEARQARVRAEELERLVSLGRALAGVTDFTALSHVLTRYLGRFARDRAAWLLIYQQGYWDVLLRDPDDRRPGEQLEAMAERALTAHAGSSPESNGVVVDDLIGFPLMGGTHLVGLLFVRAQPAITVEERRGLAAAAGLTALAIRNVRTLIDTRDSGLRDALTGCFNRAYALEGLKTELRRTRRHDRPLSVLMFDVDSFKQVNDTLGHLAGDRLLGAIGERLGELLRSTDLKCRYGGDEFLVVLPDTPQLGARQVAESIRQALGTIAIPTEEGKAASVTVSVGLACAQPDDRDALAVVGRADRALYLAKHRGRNCVCEDTEAATPLRLVTTA
jgi:diguanylate cyclase (GGDEF)-like protein